LLNSTQLAVHGPANVAFITSSDVQMLGFIIIITELHEKAVCPSVKGVDCDIMEEDLPY